jgi:hypothetical protein
MAVLLWRGALKGEKPRRAFRFEWGSFDSGIKNFSALSLQPKGPRVATI